MLAQDGCKPRFRLRYCRAMEKLSPAGIDRLLEIMKRLRDPATGCPWDREQNFATIAPYTVEEAYEVSEAIRLGDRSALRDELGDLLFQVVYHAQMAAEVGDFGFDDVVGAISDKMIRRHPHVFADAIIASAAAQSEAWEAQKARERAEKNQAEGALDGVPLALPALIRADKLQRRAARVGFDWPEAAQVLDKLSEEIGELRREIAEASGHARLEDELGDVLFALVNLARHLGVDAEAALRSTNGKFERRFRTIEARLKSRGTQVEDTDLATLEKLWQEAKADEAAQPATKTK